MVLHRDLVVKHDFFFANIVLRQRSPVAFLCFQPGENRRMISVFLVLCFSLHVFRLQEHNLSLRLAMLWSSTGILLDDAAKDRIEITHIFKKLFFVLM